jgi:hypothetical protein
MSKQSDLGEGCTGTLWANSQALPSGAEWNAGDKRCSVSTRLLPSRASPLSRAWQISLATFQHFSECTDDGGTRQRVLNSGSVFAGTLISSKSRVYVLKDRTRPVCWIFGGWDVLNGQF